MTTRTILALVVAVNLATGALVGVALDRTVLSASHGGDHPPRGGPEQISKALDLTPDQDVKVRAIMDRHRKAFESARSAERARMAAVRDEIDGEIKAVVTPAQFERLLEVRRKLEGDDHERACAPGEH